MAERFPADLQGIELADTLSSGDRTNTALQRGQAVGRYLVLSQLGEGGMGTVYAAYDPDLDRRVALKLLKFSKEGREVARARLLKEAQAMARVSHPNVLSVFEAGPFGEELFLAMELVEGDTLADWLRERERGRDEILAAYAAAGDGLAAAHAVGLVHRDFKPENVLVGRDGRVRVTDFGLAHVEERQAPVPAPAGATSLGSGSGGLGSSGGSGPTLAGTVVGTPAYMSPEQLAGSPSDARSDQFSFCVALWEALCGARPFPGKDLSEIRSSVLLGAAPVPPRSLPAPVRSALARGLSRRPEDRFPSMADLLALLHPRPKGRALRLGLAAALLGVVGGAASFALWRHAQEATPCDREAREALAQLWGAPRRQALGEVLARAGLSAEHAGGALSALDQSLGRWAEQKREACEVVRVRGDEDARVARCLERRRLRADAALTVLAAPETEAGLYVGVALERLGQPLECLDRKPRPGPAPGPQLSRLQAAAERLGLLEEMGHAAQAVKEAPAWIEEARAAGARAELAAMESVYAGALWSDEGPSAEVEALVRRAIADADASGDDDVSLSARERMVTLLVTGQGRPAEALPWVESMYVWLERIGSPPARQVEVLQAASTLESALDHGEAALSLYLRCLPLAEQAYGPHSTMVAGLHNDLGTEYSRQGRHREALAEFRRAAELYSDARLASPMEEVLGWANAGLSLLYLGEARAAMVEFERARAAIRPVVGQASTFTTWVEVMAAGASEDLGEIDRADEVVTKALAAREALDVGTLMDALHTKAKILLRQGRAAEAVPLAEESLAVSERAGELAFAALVRFTLARALWAADGDHARALELARAARDRLKGPDNEVMRGRVELWLEGK